MKIVIIGAGLIGISSAYFLQKSGHQVTVIDRQSDVALETSYANGGQLSVCYSEPWSNFSNLFHILSSLGNEDCPLLFKPKLSSQQWLWGLQFIYECLPYRNKSNIRDMLKLSLYSRKVLNDLEKELNLQYDQNKNGILNFYTSEKNYQHGVACSKFMSKFGCERIIKTAEETLAIEPSLKNSKVKIFGSDYSPDDSSGDAKIYTEQLKKHCTDIGVEFLFSKEVKHFFTNNHGDIKMIKLENILKNHNNISHFKPEFEQIEGDLFLLCAGSYTSQLVDELGIYLPIYPAKGYSLSIPIVDETKINQVSLSDMDKKTVFTKLGNQLRVAGTAEFNGYNLEINHERCMSMVMRAKEIFPEGLDYKNLTMWNGLRPSTPGNVPIIGKTKIKNLFINSGHGTLGWTMAAGSGKLISQIINQTPLYN